MSLEKQIQLLAEKYQKRADICHRKAEILMKYGLTDVSLEDSKAHVWETVALELRMATCMTYPSVK